MDDQNTEAPELNEQDETPPDEPKPTPARDAVFSKGTISVADENGNILFQRTIFNCRLHRLTSRCTQYDNELVWHMCIPINTAEESTAEQTPSDEGAEPGESNEPSQEVIAEQMPLEELPAA